MFDADDIEVLLECLQRMNIDPPYRKELADKIEHIPAKVEGGLPEKVSTISERLINVATEALNFLDIIEWTEDSTARNAEDLKEELRQALAAIEAGGTDQPEQGWLHRMIGLAELWESQADYLDDHTGVTACALSALKNRDHAAALRALLPPPPAAKEGEKP